MPVGALVKGAESVQKLTSSVQQLQRTKPVEEDSRAIALEVTGGVAPVQLTRRDMKEMSLQRLADIWKVSHRFACFPE